MMIPYGYKQTEVGVIPEDWECVKIKDVATISMCKRIFANQTSTIGDVPFYKIGTFGKEADACISSKLYVEYRNKYSFPQKGDILISAAGTLGRTVVYDGEKAYFQDSNIVWLDINKTRLCNEYLNQYYKVIKWASSEGSTIARLYNGIIYATYISLPPLPEQQRIAEALSDVDGMISSLEKLIAKYKSIKTACLQQMFPQNGETVPRIRLPGFTGAWEQRKLSDIAERFDNLRIPVAANLRIAGSTPYYGANGIQDYVDGYTHDGEFVLVAEDGANDLKNYPVQYVKGRIWVNNHAHVLQGKAKILDNRFLTYVINQADIESLLVGCGRAKLNAETMMNIVLPIPAIKEQQIIGCCLSKLDNLITLHQRKLEKIQKIKQGMMQQLLTGKIRLV